MFTTNETSLGALESFRPIRKLSYLPPPNRVFRGGVPRVFSTNKTRSFGGSARRVSVRKYAPEQIREDVTPSFGFEPPIIRWGGSPRYLHMGGDDFDQQLGKWKIKIKKPKFIKKVAKVAKKMYVTSAATTAGLVGFKGKGVARTLGIKSKGQVKTFGKVARVSQKVGQVAAAAGAAYLLAPSAMTGMKVAGTSILKGGKVVGKALLKGGKVVGGLIGGVAPAAITTAADVISEEPENTQYEESTPGDTGGAFTPSEPMYDLPPQPSYVEPQESQYPPSSEPPSEEAETEEAPEEDQLIGFLPPDYDKVVEPEIVDTEAEIISDEPRGSAMEEAPSSSPVPSEDNESNENMSLALDMIPAVIEARHGLGLWSSIFNIGAKAGKRILETKKESNVPARIQPKETPKWVAPAAIGSVALFMVLSLQKRRK